MRQGGLKSFIFSKLFTITALVLLLLIGLAVAKDYLQKQKVNSEVSAMQQEIAQLEKGNKELSSVIDYLQTSNFLEAQARTKFGLAKEGEQVVVIAGGPSGASDPVSSGAAVSNAQVGSLSISNSRQWWNYFWQ